MITKIHTVSAMRTVLVRVGAAGMALAVALGGSACGGGGTKAAGHSRPNVVVTTSILGDVVRNLVGDGADVEVVMPPGADPHAFAPSARQAEAMRAADVLVVNGLGFESALLDTIGAAEEDGVAVVTAADPIDDGEDADPHFFSDPVLMGTAAEHLAGELAARVEGLDTPAYRSRVARYLAALEHLDRSVGEVLSGVPPERRILVTNHEVFGAFAERYGFVVLGTVIPAASTLAEPSASGLRDLATAIASAQVPAIFAETSSPARLAEALAAEGTDVEVVELYSESLGAPGSEGGTYLDMVRTNAERIAAALERRG